jgi:ABC-2 type transport system permease protein
MNGVIAGITLRQLLSRRRTILLLLLGLVLVVVALLGHVGEVESADQTFTAELLSLLGVATLMPLVALLFGTGAIGSELDDGTAVYLLAKPVPRWSILLTKLAVAATCSILLTGVPILLGGLVGVGGFADGLVPAFVVAGAAGSVLYCAVFVALSLVTGRALVIGLGYILIWEGILAGLFPGTRTFSIRQQTLSIADALTDVKAEVFNAQLELGTALVMAVLVMVVAVLLGVRRLSRLEIAGETA